MPQARVVLRNCDVIDPKRIASYVARDGFKALAKALDEKVVEMAAREDVPKITGYFIGGVSPLGTHRPLPVVLETSILTMPEIAISAGEGGCQAVLRPFNLRAHLRNRAMIASFAESSGPDETR